VEQYQKWIESGAQEAVAKVKPGGHGYVIEWAVNFDPCLEVEPGKFYSVAMGDRKMGLNIALGDLDEKDRGVGNFGISIMRTGSPGRRMFGRICGVLERYGFGRGSRP